MTKVNVRKHGTGHILQDLLSSTVLLKRSNFIPPTRSQQDDNFPLKIEGDNSSPRLLTSPCSICTESGTNLRPLAVQEMNILAKFVLNQEQISHILQTDHHPAIFCCKICSSAILSLAKLTTQIENITISLRAVISSRNGLFKKLGNEFKISATRNASPTDKISNADDDQQLTKRLQEEEKITIKFEPTCDELLNKLRNEDAKISGNDDDDDQQLNGCIEEEEFSVKVEPTYDDDDEITSDPLNLSENGDDLDPVGNSVESPFVCTMCQPNVTFTSAKTRMVHMRNKNFHPDVAAAINSRIQARLASKKLQCKLCGQKFSRYNALKVHFRNQHPGENIPAKISRTKKSEKSNITQSLVPPKQNPFPCPKCDKSFTSYRSIHRHKRIIHGLVPFARKCALCPEIFARSNLFETHMQEYHKAPVSSRQEVRHSCEMCSKTLATSTSKERHVEAVHFPDKTSCPYGCDVKIGSEADWVTHLEGCDSPKMSPESKSSCRFCPAVFRNSLLQIEHRLRVHPENCYSCPTCEQKFTRQCVLDYHRCTVISSGNIRPKIETDSELSNEVSDSGSPTGKNTADDPQLPGCLEEFPVKVEPVYDDDDDEEDDDRHEITSDPLEMSPEITNLVNSYVPVAESKYVCKICQPSVTFSRSDSYERHRKNKKIHPDISDMAARLPSEKFACKICSKTYSRNRDLRRHVKNVHPVSTAESSIIERSVPSKPNRFPCPNCDQSFTSYIGLHRHKRFDHGPSMRKCTLCPQVFAGLNLLQSHMHEYHNSPKSSQDTRHSCAMCSKTFTTATTRNRHVELVHFPDKTSCPYGCETEIDSEAEWVTHLEECDSPKMSSESKGNCKLCPAVFRNIPLQIEHDLRVHPDKCYSCSICEQRFTRQTVLYDHPCTG
ncbi:Zinc finger protein 91 [Folsomia candida]|uniref:Zinc finger protein 91 n=1 Tax=Folsomia candida TaxID=158441 RepID=A0A226DX01_FOLCA|nr:Zinc finger protein 91 [Folsomia candida]